ncbi:MAG: hypothetical protein PHQ90_04945 [Sulfuricurvum sp.]|nr:hypothetical protein [Sulfuricurvum sp.]
MENHEISLVLNKIKTNQESYKRVHGVCAKLMKGQEKIVLELIQNDVSIKVIYDELLSQELLQNITYNAFYKWVQSIKNKFKFLANVDENLDETVHKNTEIIIDRVPEQSLLNNEGLNEKKMHIFQDSRDLFYGFDMNNQPDNISNPVPVRPELKNEIVSDIFLNDHTLTNEKITKILLCNITIQDENDFKDVWSHLLIQDSETVDEYYNRLQQFVLENPQHATGVFRATSLFNRYALLANFDKIKIIRS